MSNTIASAVYKLGHKKLTLPPPKVLCVRVSGMECANTQLCCTTV